MWKDKLRMLGEYFVKHGKYIIPVIVMAAAAVTVVVALNAGKTDVIAIEPEETKESVTTEAEEAQEKEVPTAPMEANTDGALYTLLATYYNAKALGDVETIRTIKSYVDEKEVIRIEEQSQYIDTYPQIDIYTKEGAEENSYLVYVNFLMKVIEFEDQLPGMQAFYVCTAEDGSLYIKEEQDWTEEDIAYITEINSQDDVFELQNRVSVECSEIYMNNAKLHEYMEEMNREVNAVIDAKLSKEEEGTDQTTENGAAEGTENEEAPVQELVQEPVNEEPLYAKATTTVNVRSSDSERADKVSKVSGGTKVQVLEQRANGWSKITHEGIEGFIKSEYLQLDVPVEGGEVIGTVTAISNVNIRRTASETAEKLGIVTGGDSVELISKENGWCKIQYNGLVGYVKEDFVQ